MDRVESIHQFREHILKDSHSLEELFARAKNENSWFTDESITMALEGICEMLEPSAVSKWLQNYSPVKESKTIGLVLAGNIPMVGFHDLLSVFLSGHSAQIKLSSKDGALIRYFVDFINEKHPEEPFKVVEKLENFDAVIATGSTNTSRYFDYYFGKYPNIIRKNRTSLALLTGNESDEELTKLGSDVFSYFGLGCRNVSSLLLPTGFEITRFGELWNPYADVIQHHKYANNYDYQKSLLLINKVEHLDFGYLLLKESMDLHSALSSLHYSFYDGPSMINSYLEAYKDDIQCIVGRDVDPGKAQSPALWDYADGVDTMEFLSEL